MFGFRRRKTGLDMQAHLRRIADLTIPNRTSSENPLRFEDRNNRTVPVLVCPWTEDGPDLSRCVMAVTKDISDRGVSVVMNHPLVTEEVVIGFFLPGTVMLEPWFFRGAPRRNVSIGGGFWLLAVELLELMNQNGKSHIEPLFPIAQKLLPTSRKTPCELVEA